MSWGQFYKDAVWNEMKSISFVWSANKPLSIYLILCFSNLQENKIHPSENKIQEMSSSSTTKKPTQTSVSTSVSNKAKPLSSGSAPATVSISSAMINSRDKGNLSKTSLESYLHMLCHKILELMVVHLYHVKGQITISSYPSPLFGIQFLAIPFAFDFAFKMHIKDKSFKQSINEVNDMLAYQTVLLWFKEGGSPQFGRVINGLSANISHPVV